MRIFGLDPANVKNLGVGYIDVENKKIVETFTCLEKIPKFDTAGERLNYILRGVDLLHDDLKPNIVSVEQSMGFGLAWLRQNLQENVAMIKYSCYKNEIELVEVSPAHVKKIITNNGRAKKKDMIASVKTLLNIDKKISEHEADALSCALCYCVDIGLLDPFHKEVKKTTKRMTNGKTKLKP